MKKSLIMPHKTWLYVVVITVCILNHDEATNDFPGISGDATRSGLLDSDTTLTRTMMPQGNNPSVTAASSSSSTFIVDTITDDDKDGNHVSTSELSSDDQYRLNRPHTKSLPSDDENKGRGGVQVAKEDDEFSRWACPPTKSQPAAPSRNGQVLSRHTSSLVPIQEEELIVNKNIPKNHHHGPDETAAKECRDDIVLMTTDDVPRLARNPITIISQDDKTVTFSISDPFETESLLDSTSTTTIFYQYVPAQTGATTCAAMTTSSKTSWNLQQPVEITAHCMASPSRQSSLAIVDLWFVDSSTVRDIHDDTHDYASLPKKCLNNMHEKQQQQQHDGSILSNHGTTFLYSYKIYCQSQCTRSRTLLAEPHEGSEPVTSSSDALSNNDLLKSNNDKQDRFLCEAKDYPCGGDGNMVQVCHYSTRDGYRTHCIPQSESRSLIGYFWKDYCGPCVVEGQGK